MCNLDNTLVGGESNTGIRSPNASTLRPVKRRFFSFLCLYTTQIIILKNISILNFPVLNSVAKK